ncbi:MAG TPA: hypothetical protein VF980_00115, partial [Thermoanaerobaculia bacterium]
EMQIERIEGEGDISGPVRLSSGPWRIEEGWWKDAPAAREYWDVEVGAAVYRVFECGAGWVVDARYD